MGSDAVGPYPNVTSDHEDDSQPPPPLLPRDQQRKTATYDYAYEKSLSHAEAKLFYQHHQLASRDNTVPPSPVPAGRSGDFHGEELPASATDPSSQTDKAMTIEADSLPWRPGGRDRPSHQVDGSPIATNYLTPAEGPSLGTTEGLPGANVGLGISQGTDSAGSAVTTELAAIYRKIKGLLDRRFKYMDFSVQVPEDDPRNQSEWEIYPPPPEPAWDVGNEYQPGNVGGPSDWTGKKRKMGQDIGEDFDMAELMPLPGESTYLYRLDGNSVYQVYESSSAADQQQPIVQIPSLRDFYMDLDSVVDVSTDGPVKSFAFKRLSYLEGKFQLYALLNEYQEIADSKKVPHRDFYNVRKVDTHVHHSACMNQKHLLRFIKSKMRKSPDEVVLFRDGKHLTLREVFESINLTAYDLSIDTLDMHVSFFLSLLAHLESLIGLNRRTPTLSIGSTSLTSNITPWGNPGCVKFFSKQTTTSRAAISPKLPRKSSRT